jgi:hypothetical protein
VSKLPPDQRLKYRRPVLGPGCGISMRHSIVTGPLLKGPRLNYRCLLAGICSPLGTSERQKSIG